MSPQPFLLVICNPWLNKKKQVSFIYILIYTFKIVETVYTVIFMQHDLRNAFKLNKS